MEVGDCRVTDPNWPAAAYFQDSYADLVIDGLGPRRRFGVGFADFSQVSEDGCLGLSTNVYLSGILSNGQYRIAIQASVSSSLECTNSCNFSVPASARASMAFRVGPLPEIPRVQFATENQGIVVSWPIDPTNFVLEVASSLNAPVTWMAVTNAPVAVGATNTVSLPTARQSSFYRLRYVF
jgi:hypothetical protein